VSTLVKSQFLASQLAMLLTFLPAMMLSGFLYDLRSMPAVIRGITYALPARYAVTLLQTLYLAGDVGSVIWLNLAVLAAMAAALMVADPAGHPQAALLRHRMRASLLRILALIRKEFLAVLKDPRSRFIIFLPPMLQCLIFGYAASFDLNSVAYAVLDQDHSAASADCSSRLDGSGVFRAPGRPRPRRGHRHLDRQRPRAARHPNRSGFRAPSARRRTAPLEVIADGRNSNTAGTALGYLESVVDGLQRDWRSKHGQGGPASGRHPLLVQPEPRLALEHDPEPDRHADDDGHDDADGPVRRPRARAGNLRPAAGHAVSAVRNHGGKGHPNMVIGLGQSTTIC
jgi:hypothetical protein